MIDARHALALLALFSAACSGGDSSSEPTRPPATAAAAATTTPAASAATGTGTRTAPATSELTTTAAAPASSAPVTAPPTDPPPATTAPAAAADFSVPGPYPVGVTTLAPAAGPLVEVWYPAGPGSAGTVTYDVRDVIPAAIRDLLTADLPATFTIDGQRDAAPAEGRFPVVVFSHGFAGFRQESSFLTAHLASYGIVVAAPDHPGRDLYHVLDGDIAPDPTVEAGDLLTALALVADPLAAGPLAAHVDLERVGALGYSAGGRTVLTAAAIDPRIDGIVSMASGLLDAAAPTVPSFFLAGDVDAVVPAAAVTAPAFEAAAAPTWYWLLAGVGHNGFSDLCTLGGGTGVVGLADASGLGPILDAQPQLRTLGEDGCLPPAVPTTDSFPVIRHGVTAWFRWLFGDDADPVGLDPAPDAWPVAVTAAHRSDDGG